MQFDEEIREFLIESNENLVLLDQDIVHLEKRPDDIELVSSAFRIIHTIKGTCGFFGYTRLGAVTHLIENLLGQVREGKRVLSPELITLVLEGVDEVKALIRSIEDTGKDEEGFGSNINERLEDACSRPGVASHAAAEESMPEPQNAAAAALLQDGAVEAADPRHAQRNALPNPDSRPFGAADTHPLPAPQEEPHKSTHEAAESLSSREGSREALLVESTIRVDVGLLNRLINLVGELVLARNQLLQDASLQSPVL